MSKPNLLILGPSRSATTSLYYLLGQHPQIFAPKIKEPKYFTSNSDVNPRSGPGDKLLKASIISNYNDYLNLFSDSESKYKVDGSSDYFFYLSSIALLLKEKCDKNLHVVIMLRNPIDRTYSSYLNLVRDNRFNGSFDDYIHNQEKWKNLGYDPMWLGGYGSLYADRVKLLKKEFDNHLILFFDDFKDSSLSVLEEIEKFLGLKQNIYTNIDIVYSPSYKQNLISKLVSRDNILTSMFRDILIGLFGREKLETIASYFFKKNKSNIRFNNEKWKNLFVKDIEELEKLISKDLSSWK